MFQAEKIVFKTVGSTEVSAIAYWPEQRNSKMPVCFWFHGGGWMYGDGREPELYPRLSRGLLNAGIAILSCEYRLANGKDIVWRQLIDDCSDFIWYFSENAGKFGLDLSRAMVAGTSAGGHLALLEAFGGEHFGTGGKISLPNYKCILDMCGPVDMEYALDVKETAALKMYLRRFLGNDSAKWPEIYPCVSSIRYAEKLPLERLVPVIAVQGTADELVNPRQPLILGELYRRTGREFELLSVENGAHSFGNVPGLPNAFPDMDEIQRRLLEFALGHI